MLKPSRKPYGFKELLAYKKSEILQGETEKLASHFSRTKTLIALADQMNRSARSAKQNIVEGWKRNSTREYFDFLGFAIGSNTELEEDCNDILKGFYPDLMGIKGIMGEMGEMGERDGKGIMGEMGEKGLRGEKGERGIIGNPFSHPSYSTPPTPPTPPSPPSPQPHPTNPSTPYSSPAHSSYSASAPRPSQPPPTPPTHFTPFSLYDIEKLPFYPLDLSLAPIIQLKLRSKELNFLLSQLQKSLETKMQNENTLVAKDKFKLQQQQKQKEKDFKKELRDKYLNPIDQN